MPWSQSVTSLTLALMEDTGWYRANYSASPGVLVPPAYGYGAGCPFLTHDCIADGGSVPDDFGAGNPFCNVTTDASGVRCDATHARAARCDLVDHGAYGSNPTYPYLDAPDPPGAEYRARFGAGDADAADGGGALLGSFLRFDAEYCPTYASPTSFVYDADGVPTGPVYMDCSLGETAPADAYDFEWFGDVDGGGGGRSACFDTLGVGDDVGGVVDHRPLCLRIECAEYGGAVAVAVSVGADGETVVCEADGQVVDLPGLTDVKIVCPRREILCPGYALEHSFLVGWCSVPFLSLRHTNVPSNLSHLPQQHRPPPVFIARPIAPDAAYAATGS
jgi:hypothetical protein